MEEPTTFTGELATGCRKYFPNLAVYLPKDVTVSNPKLGFLNACNLLIVFFLASFYFISNDDHTKMKNPDTKLSICGYRNCILTAAEHDMAVNHSMHQGHCNGDAPSVTRFEREYKDMECAGRCGSSNASAAGSCMLTEQLMETNAHEVFFPTFYQETFVTRPENNSCASGFQLQSQGSGGSPVCQKQGNYYVGGAGANNITFYHEFAVDPHITIMNYLITPETRKSHSGSFQSTGWDQGLVTYLIDRHGNKKATFSQSQAVRVSLDDLISAAQYEDYENPADLTLDSKFGPDGVPLRLSGALLTVDLYSTDSGNCPVFDVMRSKAMLNREVDSGVPTTCMTVYVDPRWTEKETMHHVHSGGTRFRTMHGIRVNFRLLGGFAYTDDQVLFNHITVFFVWIKLPLQITTFFCLWFLGKLSSIYGRVFTQELNLKEACKGLMARLMHHSAAFMDLKDHDNGISKERIHDRFKDFLLDNEDIDEEELTRFVEFVFDGLKGTGHHPNSDKLYVSLQEFCEVCSSNEPLNFQALVRLFDQDRKQGLLESFFLDPSLKGLQNTEAPSTLKIEPLDYTKVGSNEAAVHGHSRVDSVANEVDEMLRNLKTMEHKALKTAGNLEIGSEVIGLRDVESKKKTQPKLEQSESFCSILDEEDEAVPGDGGDYGYGEESTAAAS